MSSSTEAPVLTRQQANDYLQQIRTDHQVDNSESSANVLVKMLHNSLKMAVDQPNSKPTHFLLELIQNADDNTYPKDVKPALSLTLKTKHKLTITCNEIGFSKRNVSAICDFGETTKTVEDGTKGFIGEKGIGFKSVFRVANIVSISSGPFQFSLDRRQILGMVTPIISEEQKINTGTYMNLDLKSQVDYDNIQKDIGEIKPEILIFLRKISQLTISTPSRHEKINAVRGILKSVGFLGEMIRLEVTSTLSSASTSEMEYIISRHTMTGLPEEELRPGVEQSEIVLAFPVAPDTNPILKSQYTYAYLPIDEFGFSYLIQADFILTANRESIAIQNDWNIFLRSQIVVAFRNAVYRFIETTGTLPHHGLRYTWPRFLLISGGSSSEFWAVLRADILSALSSELILESRDESANLKSPTSLWYIPTEFRFLGEPMLEDETMRSRHLSFLYNIRQPQDIECLNMLGVQQMTFSVFFDDLEEIITRHGAVFLQNKPDQWHAALANVLMRNISVRSSRILQLPLIPLRDGRWVLASERNIFLNSELTNSDVPNGIDMCLVDTIACENKDREVFFRWLGIRPCNRKEVCDMILKKHLTAPRNRDLDEYVSDVLFLYEIRNSYSHWDLRDLWLLSSRMEPSKGKLLYLDLPEKPFAISKFSNDKSGIRMLHPQYVEKLQAQHKKIHFVAWLIKCGVLSTLPQLIFNHQPSRELQYFTSVDSKTLILLLRDNWDYYKPQIDRYVSVKKMLSEMRVIVTGSKGTRYELALNKSLLPLQQLKEAACLLDFLDIPEPEDPRWLKFEELGVITKLTQELYIRQLDMIKSSMPSPVIPTEITTHERNSAIHDIYKRLATPSSRTDDTSLKSTFISNNLVYRPRDASWVSLRDCVWEAPTCLRKVYALSLVYPDCKAIFCDKLGICDATIDHVVEEVLDLRPNVGYVNLYKNLLLLLNEYLRNGSPAASVQRLKDIKVFPVIFRHEQDLHEIMFQDHRQTWYIADTSILQQAFVDKVRLMHFTIAEVKLLTPLINAMGLKEKLISRAVEQRMEKIGNPVIDESKTLEIKSRASYLFRLAPAEKRTEELILILRSATVWKVSAMKLKRSLKGVEGTDEEGDVKFEITDSGLNIYIRSDNSESSMVTYRLSEQFINLCCIEDTKHQHLVTPILEASSKCIEALLEENGIDGLSKEQKPIIIELDSPDEDRSPDFSLIPLLRQRPGIPTMDQNIASSSGAFSRYPFTSDGVQPSLKRPRTSGESDMQEFRKVIGFLGEEHIHRYLSKQILGWSESNWTSKSRIRAGHTPFLEEERDFSDFTYHDNNGALTKLFMDRGFSDAKDGRTPKYHLEVKSTIRSCNEPFYMSNNQIEKARIHTIPENGVPTEVYVVLRVFNLKQATPPDFVAYIDPWGMFKNETLTFQSSGTWNVTPS